MKRREFFQLGLAGTAVLALGRVGLAAAPAGVVTAEDQRRLAAIARAMLGPMLPADGPARVAQAIDGIVRTLPPATQAEIRDLLDLLGLAPARLLLAGFWSDWPDVPSAEASQALDDWRTSRFALLRSAYGGLHELIMAAWYGDPAAWPRIGYPGPPEVERPPAWLK